MRVGEVARATGVSVRTLHHWEDVGLVVPSRTGSYRSYGADDLARLQRVLVYRELGLGLDQVRALLDDESNPLDALRQQHRLLTDRIDRLQAVAAAVARAVEAREMGIDLDPHEIREVFGEHDPAEHAQEAQDRWGDTDAYRQAQQRTSAFGKQDWLDVRAEGDAVEERFVALLRAGVPPTSAQARDVALEHRAWVSRFYDCSAEVHRGLAATYLADERFTAHYEQRAPGLAQYVHDAVVAAAGG